MDRIDKMTGEQFLILLVLDGVTGNYYSAVQIAERIKSLTQGKVDLSPRKIINQLRGLIEEQLVNASYGCVCNKKDNRHDARRCRFKVTLFAKYDVRKALKLYRSLAAAIPAVDPEELTRRLRYFPNI